MPFPVEALKVLVELIKAGLASGNLLSYLVTNWAEAAGAIIELLKWIFQQAKPEPIGLAQDAEVDALFGQLVACWQEETGVVMDGPATFSPSLLLSILMWLVQLWANRQE